MKKKIQQFWQDWSTPEKAKKKQILLLVISMVAFVAVFSSIFLVSGSSEEKIPFSLENTKGKITISDVTSGADAEDRWIELAETKLQNIDKIDETLKRLEAENIELKEKLAEAFANKDAVLDHKALIDGYYDEIQALNARIDELSNKKKLYSDRAPEGHPQKVILPNEVKSNKAPFTPGSSTSPTVFPEEGIQDISFTLEGAKENFNYFNTSEYLPAGSYVSAVVISGVDASVGLSSQADPRPILFRINGQARSAVHNDKELEVGLKGCIVTGAASGDLSSEKVFVRLLKMTCAHDDESVIETEVKGYASAVGKAGVRGPVTSREGDLVVKSFFAGLAGGVGSGVAQRMTTPATIVGGIATEEPTTKDIVGQGLGRGLESSADRIADYLIDRAEQYQPVITIAAGINVELIFHDGVYLDGRKKEKKS